MNGSCDRACKVCEAPCMGGEIEHGKGCRHMFEEGGGVEECDGQHDQAKALGTLCSVCYEPQHETRGGACCKNGHGGADPIRVLEKPLSFRQVAAVTMKMHAAAMVLGANSREVQRIRSELVGHPERLSEDQQASLRELSDWLTGYAERNGLS